MPLKCAVLDDYQQVAAECGDWGSLSDEVTVSFFHAPLGGPEQVVAALKDFEIICLMRERTPFPRAVIEVLPQLKLIVTSAMRNASIDVAAAGERGIVVCGTEGIPFATAELAFGLLLNLARQISREDAALKAGAPWQSTIGVDLKGRNLGVLGLGKLGSRMVHYARAFDMHPIAWSQNLTPAKAAQGGAEFVSKEALFELSDFLSIHVVLSARTRALVGKAELSRMKKTAYLINTARGPVVEEDALLDALRSGQIAGAALDVFDIEPLPPEHPFRQAPNLILTPHLGYVTRDTYRAFYRGMVEDIRAWLAGRPIRVL